MSTPTNPSSFISGRPHLYDCTPFWLTCEVHNLSLHIPPYKYQFIKCGKSVRVVFVCVHHLNIFLKDLLTDRTHLSVNRTMAESECALKWFLRSVIFLQCAHSPHSTDVSHTRLTVTVEAQCTHTLSHTHIWTHTHHGCKQSQGCDFNYHLVLA